MKVRCIDNGLYETTLTVGRVYEVEDDFACDQAYAFQRDDGSGVGFAFKRRFEPVSDTIPAPPPDPAKVDPYEAHRLNYPDEVAIAEDMATRGRTYGDTARLHAGLAAEKPVVRVKPFPKDARNPR